MESSKRIDGEYISLDDLYDKHKKFVSMIAKRMQPVARRQGWEFEDTRNTCVEGFVQAYERFDETMGYKFTTYAGSLMRGSVLRRLREYGTTIHFTRTVKEISFKIYKYKLIDEPIPEIAKQLEVTEVQVEEAIMYSRSNPLSMDETISDDGVTIHEMIGEKVDFLIPIHMKQFFATLPEDERKVVKLRIRGISQQKIGEELGTRQVQVSRILRKVRKKYDTYNKGEMII